MIGGDPRLVMRRVESVTGLVVPAGVEVVLTGNMASFGVEESRVVYYDDEDREPADRVASALGIEAVGRASERVNVVDLTIVIGTDFAAA